MLIPFSVKVDGMTVERSLIKRNFNSFLFLLNFFTLAPLTFLSFFNNLSLSFTGIAIFLNLLIHPRTHLIHLHHSSLSFASFTAFNTFTTFSMTNFTTADSLYGHFDHLSFVTLFKGHFKCFFYCFCFSFLSWTSSTPSSTTTKEHIHYVYLVKKIPA